MQSAESNQSIVLPPMGTLNPEETANKSKTHWFWTPYHDISNMGPLEIRSQLGYRDSRWTEFKRCTPYPLGNLISYEPDRSVAEGAAGMSMNSEHLPKIEYVKYAQAQAAELGQSYEDVGGRVLLPLIGMDDRELVGRIFEVVQPFAYSIHEMQEEFTSGTKKRIEASNLSETEKQTAYALAKVLLSGAVQAERKANAEYELLITSMSDAQVGKPGISNPNEFHHWLCAQLGRPVPERINRMANQGSDSATIKALLDRDAERQRELEDLKRQMAQRAPKTQRVLAEA